MGKKWLIEQNIQVMMSRKKNLNFLDNYSQLQN